MKIDKASAMTKDCERFINLFGALVLGLGDRLRLAVNEGLALGGEAVAALVVIGHRPGLSIDQLGQVLRLSHPGTVRIVDRLVAAGLAERLRTVDDRRVATLHLSAAGRSERQALLARRHQALRVLLEELSEAEQAMLHALSERLLTKLPVDAVSALTVCRFCDEGACVSCPMQAFDAVSVDVG